MIPASAVVHRTAQGDVTHCPLNSGAQAPQPGDVLDAERVDQILALVNHRYALAAGKDPSERVALSALAARADVLERQIV